MLNFQLQWNAENTWQLDWLMCKKISTFVKNMIYIIKQNTLKNANWKPQNYYHFYN